MWGSLGEKLSRLGGNLPLCPPPPRIKPGAAEESMLQVVHSWILLKGLWAEGEERECYCHWKKQKRALLKLKFAEIIFTDNVKVHMWVPGFCFFSAFFVIPRWCTFNSDIIAYIPGNFQYWSVCFDSWTRKLWISHHYLDSYCCNSCSTSYIYLGK